VHTCFCSSADLSGDRRVGLSCRSVRARLVSTRPDAVASNASGSSSRALLPLPVGRGLSFGVSSSLLLDVINAESTTFIVGCPTYGPRALAPGKQAGNLHR